MLNAYFFDAQKHTLNPLILDETKLLEQLYINIDCEVVEHVAVGIPCTVYVDEEGLFKELRPWRLGTHILFGNAVFLGLPDCEGNDTDIDLSVQEIFSLIQKVIL
jgi:hypothetical protein